MFTATRKNGNAITDAIVMIGKRLSASYVTRSTSRSAIGYRSWLAARPKSRRIGVMIAYEQCSAGLD
jgi:hypothetical protein